MAGADRVERGKDIRGAIAEREKSDCGHGRGEIEQRRELGCDNGEVGLGSFNENVEVEEKEERKEGNGEGRIGIEETVMEGEIVDEAMIGGGGAAGEEGPVRDQWGTRRVFA